jgi:hypothetical protein
MTEVWNYIQELATTQGLDLLVSWLLAFLVLLAGWAFAMFFAYLVRVGLKRTEIDNRLVKWLVGEEQGEKLEVERWISPDPDLRLRAAAHRTGSARFGGVAHRLGDAFRALGRHELHPAGRTSR